MLITADWVIPVSRPPIKDGAVIVRNGHIAEVGRARELAGLDVSGDRHDFPGCVMMPGLVNAHTHLSLSAMGGLFAPEPFVSWLPRLVTAMSAWDNGDHAASAALGAARCLQSGVTVVGDIVYGPESSAVAADMGLGGTFYWEVLGISTPKLFARLEELDFPIGDCGCGKRIRCGLSPHSPYTAGPRLIQAIHEAVQEFKLPMAMHLAESADEVRLLKDGTGPLADVAARLADGFKAPNESPVSYVDHLGALDGTTLVHAGFAGPVDITRIAATARGVVACPRSNAFLHNPLAPVERLLHAGVPVGIGTDSAASNDDLDLMQEVRALHDEHPLIEPHTLIQMATLHGAVTLGLEDRFGVLEPGMEGDIAIFDVGPTSQPEYDIVRSAGRSTLRAVATAGVWRVLDGQLVEDLAPIETAARAAHVRAEHSLRKA